MSIEIKDGKVELNIAGALDADELRQLLRSLCDAHAKLTNARGPQDEPLFAWNSSDMLCAAVNDNMVRIALKTPAFGWIGLNIPVLGVLEVIANLSRNAANLVAAADSKSTAMSGAAH